MVPCLSGLYLDSRFLWYGNFGTSLFQHVLDGTFSACVYELIPLDGIVVPVLFQNFVVLLDLSQCLLDSVIEEYIHPSEHEKKKNSNDDDSSLLEDIEKTTIIKLKNKTLKVSPYRKNKDDSNEKKTIEEESNKKTTRNKKDEDIEIL